MSGSGRDLKAMRPANDHGRCSICGRPGTVSYRPFCSKRCADIDLARWLGDGYVIPGRGTDDDEDGDAGSGEATGEHPRQNAPRSGGNRDGDA